MNAICVARSRKPKVRLWLMKGRDYSYRKILGKFALKKLLK